jgi:pimeloyl-ACP methyl ester carboxylesterase
MAIVGPVLLLATAWAVLVLGLALTVVWKIHRPPRRGPGWALAHGKPVDPQEATLSSTTETIDFEGAPIDLWRISGSQADGPQLLIVHGWADSRIGALAWAQVLKPIVRELILFDLPAHGDSQLKSYRWDDARCVLSVIDHVASDAPLVLMGHSWSGRLTCRAARDRPAVAAVVLDSAAQHADRGVRVALRRAGLPRWPVASLVMRFMSTLIRTDLSELAANIPQPLLAISGDSDELAPAADAQAIAVAAPNGQVNIFPNADHLQSGCLHPSEYLQTIKAFFDSLPPGKQNK